jgi:hypothetical protein
VVEDATMTCIRFTISEELSGWFVSGPDKLGPFLCKQRAVDLAEGMVSALRAIGEDSEMWVAGHPDPFPLPPGPVVPDLWRFTGPRLRTLVEA